MFFASNALYPVNVMPAWLHLLAHVNPLSYEVDALRALLIGTPFNPADIAVLVVAAVLGIATASTLLRRLVSLSGVVHIVNYGGPTSPNRYL